MLTDLLTATIFFLPAGLANAIPVIVAKVPFLKKFDYPLDCHKTYKGERILGDHKTMRGVVFGIAIAVIAAFILQSLYLNQPWFANNVAFDFAAVNPWIFGILSAIGALGGDAVKSFFKRRTSIKPGDTWFPFDQIDYIIGGCLLLALYARITLVQYFYLLLVYFGLHLLTSYLGYLLKFKSKPI